MMRALACFVSLFFALPAFAQDDPSLQRFNEGVEHLRAERYEEAAAAFRASYRLSPRVTTMCNLALTYDRWAGEHRSQALSAYRSCANDDDAGQFRPFAERRVRELERELALTEQARAPEREEAPRTAERRPPRRVAPRRAEPDHALLYAGIGTGALAVGAFVPAVVLAVDAQDTVDALRRELGPNPEIVAGSPEHQRLNDAQTKAVAATVLYVVSGVAAATAIALVLMDLLGVSEPAPAVSLVPTSDGVWLGASAHF